MIDAEALYTSPTSRETLNPSWRSLDMSRFMPLHHSATSSLVLRFWAREATPVDEMEFDLLMDVEIDLRHVEVIGSDVSLEFGVRRIAFLHLRSSTIMGFPFLPTRSYSPLEMAPTTGPSWLTPWRMTPPLTWCKMRRLFACRRGYANSFRTRALAVVDGTIDATNVQHRGCLQTDRALATA